MKVSHFIAIATLASIVGASCTGGTVNVAKKYRKHHHRLGKSKQLSSTTLMASTVKITNPKHRNTTTTSHTNPNTSSANSTMSGVGQNGIFLGLLPDEGDAGGQRQTMAELNKAMGAKAATYGWYAQAQSGTAFDGSQLLAIIDDVKASGAIFEPAVMPTGGWSGLTASDDSQAVNICNVMKKFTDQGIEVRLRFAHEVNWYQTDGTYTGGASDFKAGWAAVAKACKKIAPSVKMFFTPNVASLSQYDEYFPDDPSTVDLIGIDYYPQSLGGSGSFVDTMKPFHDKYTSDTTRFAIGETGLGFSGSIQERVQWLSEIMSSATAKAMPNFVSVSWFNFQKGYDFMIVDPNDSSTTKVTTSFLGV